MNERLVGLVKGWAYDVQLFIFGFAAIQFCGGIALWVAAAFYYPNGTGALCLVSLLHFIWGWLLYKLYRFARTWRVYSWRHKK